MSVPAKGSKSHLTNTAENIKNKKLLRKSDKPSNHVSQNYGTNRRRFRTIKNSKKPASSYEAARAEYERVKSEKKAAKERQQKRKQEIEAALNVYKEKKKLKNKKLSAKTAKGQPIMKNKIELLLDKIQHTVK